MMTNLRSVSNRISDKVVKKINRVETE